MSATRTRPPVDYDALIEDVQWMLDTREHPSTHISAGQGACADRIRSAPAGAGNTPRGLTRSSGTSREGLGMKPTHIPPVGTTRRTPYKTETRPEHPLAMGTGRVRTHRAVLYDTIGPGSHPCHWCGQRLDWFSNPRIQADHLDGDTWNNDPANLVPACIGCNGSRPNWQATECPQGHPFDDENTYVPPATAGLLRPHRQCRECRRNHVRRQRARRREREAS